MCEDDFLLFAMASSDTEWEGGSSICRCDKGTAAVCLSCAATLHLRRASESITSMEPGHEAAQSVRTRAFDTVGSVGANAQVDATAALLQRAAFGRETPLTELLARA